MQFSPPPDVDTLSTKLPPLNHHDTDKMLPSLSSVTGVHALRGDTMLEQHNMTSPSPHWPPLNGPLAYRQPANPTAHRADSPATMDFDGSNSVTSAPSPDLHSSSNSLNLDDPDVRLAAEALGDLRAGTCCHEFNRWQTFPSRHFSCKFLTNIRLQISFPRRLIQQVWHQ
jgi:hypothetical protein